MLPAFHQIISNAGEKNSAWPDPFSVGGAIF